MRTLFIATLLGLAACSTPMTDHNAQTAGAQGPRDCFLASSASGYGYVDEHTVRITAGGNRHYLLRTNWNVRDLDWTEVIALRARGSHWICTGSGLDVEVTGGRPPQTYPITSVTREPDAPQGS